MAVFSFLYGNFHTAFDRHVMFWFPYGHITHSLFPFYLSKHHFFPIFIVTTFLELECEIFGNAHDERTSVIHTYILLLLVFFYLFFGNQHRVTMYFGCYMKKT